MSKEEDKEQVNVGGRPPFYETPEELIEKINEYFHKGLKKRKVVCGKKPNEIVSEVPVPTITGLTAYLGFESRTAFYDYEKKNGFKYTIKRARLFIEQEYEEQLQFGNTTGAIFALKNMGWYDRHEIDHRDIPVDPLDAVKKQLESDPGLAEQLLDEFTDNR